MYDSDVTETDESPTPSVALKLDFSALVRLRLKFTVSEERLELVGRDGDVLLTDNWLGVTPRS